MTDADTDSDAVVELQDDLRGELKAPLGLVYTDPSAFLADAGTPIIAVGDIVTYHLVEAGRVPDVALVDGRTKRTAVDDEIQTAISGFSRRVAVTNPAGTLTEELLEALTAAVRAAVDGDDRTRIVVDGEEDLATLPAVLTAPESASIVYGQPDEGMVDVRVDEETIERCRELLTSMDGDPDRLFDILER